MRPGYFGLVSRVRAGVSTPSTSTFSGSPPHLAATRVPPACSGRSTRGPRRGRFWERVHAHRRAPAGSDWHPLRRGPWRPATRGGPARPCLGGGGSAWGDALGVRTGVLVSGDGPVMRGVRDVGQGAGVGDRRHGGSVTAECGGGVHGQDGAELAAATISLSLSRVHRLRTPAPPPRSRAVWDGRQPLQPPLRRPGASAPVMAGEAPAVRRAP